MADNPILNPDAIQALRDLSPEGNDDFLRELIAIYLEDTPKEMAKLEDALSRQDSDKVARAAHTIKGSSGNFGAMEFARIAHTIELHGKANDLPAVTAALPEFKQNYARVAEALQKLAAGT